MSGKILLTGISGWIAKHTAIELLNSGYEVLGTVRNKSLIENNLINLNLQKFLFKKYNIFFSVIEYNDCKWLRAVLLNPFFNTKHIKKICLAISKFSSKENKILKSMKIND